MMAAVAAGHISGDGAFTRQAAQLLEEIIGSPKVLLTTSCTDALEMTAILVGIEPGDEVILPAFTFVSCANAFVLRGAKPVFADIRGDTLNVDERALDRLITPRTRAIVAVHYAGIGCDMEAILRIAAERSLTVIEDNAHGLFGKRRDRMLGSFAPLATQSFHETKNVNCGEGGALVINDPRFIDRAEIIREKGTNRSRFFRGLVDKYTWVDVGSSFLMSDLLAAYLLGQLERRDDIQQKRRAVWHRYHEALGEWAERHGAALPFVPDDCEQPYHMFYVILPSLADRQSLLKHLRESGIVATFHYVPLNTTPMAARFGAERGMCPVAEAMSDRLLRLPFYNSLSNADQDLVIEAMRRWRD